jgi:hypothetical protein
MKQNLGAGSRHLANFEYYIYNMIPESKILTTHGHFHWKEFSENRLYWKNFSSVIFLPKSPVQGASASSCRAAVECR